MARGHPQPRHAPLLGSLSEASPGGPPGPYQGPGARWYGAEDAWKQDDIDFYRGLAEEHAGLGGHVLELGAGDGRVALPMLRAGFRVTALDSSPDMLAWLRERLDPGLEARFEGVRQDMRSFTLDRLFRFIYMPFNTLLVMALPHERQQALERIREHLAPSGAFAFEVFTPDPARLHPEPDWTMELEIEADDPGGAGVVHVERERRRAFDYGRQQIHIEWRHRVTQGQRTLAEWEDDLKICYLFPGELELLLERQGFRIRRRFGGGDRRPYNPTVDDMQAQFVVAEPAP